MNELHLLVAIGILAVLLYVPSMLAKLSLGGFPGVIGNREATPELPEWANRADRAQRNMVDNLAPFAILIIAATMAGASSDQVAMGTGLFFWGRLAHAVSYIAGISYIRSVAFVVALGGHFTIAAATLAAL